MRVPQGPGLGVDPDPALIARYRTHDRHHHVRHHVRRARSQRCDPRTDGDLREAMDCLPLCRRRRAAFAPDAEWITDYGAARGPAEMRSFIAWHRAGERRGAAAQALHHQHHHQGRRRHASAVSDYLSCANPRTA
jgi:hypothetical protein